jgi:hypothetical protein
MPDGPGSPALYSQPPQAGEREFRPGAAGCKESAQRQACVAYECPFSGNVTGRSTWPVDGWISGFPAFVEYMYQPPAIVAIGNPLAFTFNMVYAQRRCKPRFCSSEAGAAPSAGSDYWATTRSIEQPSPDEFCIVGHYYIDHEKNDRPGNDKCS